MSEFDSYINTIIGTAVILSYGEPSEILCQALR